MSAGETPTPSTTTAQRRWLLLTWLAALLLYGTTLAPTIHVGDTAELAAAGNTWGIPHPPGYPLYSFVANIWSRVVRLGDPAWRSNLLSAFAAASAVLLLALWIWREVGSFGVSLLAALSLALGQSFWHHALVAEVYAFDVALLAATFYASRCVAQRAGGAALFFLGLSGATWLGHRPVNLLYAPAILVLLWPSLRGGELWRRGGRDLALLFIGALLPALIVVAYPMLASRQQPLIDSVNPESWSQLWELLSASVYRRYFFAGSPWVQGTHIVQALPRELGLLLPLACVGAFLLWRDHRRAAYALLYLAGANAIFVLTYGVPDVLAFTLPGLFALTALAGAGAGLLWRHGRCALRRGLLVLLSGNLVLLLAFNYGPNDLSQRDLARHFARDALDLPVAKALVLSHVDSVTFGLWYAQAVEQRRPDLEVVSRGRAVPWYQAQVRARRPDLEVPSYEGPDAASHWPALLVQRNLEKTHIYLTSDLRGYFFGRDLQRLAREVRQEPAGLLIELVRHTKGLDLEGVVARNERFWARAWSHAQRARAQRLGTDMTALLLHYASMRLLYGRFCALHGRLEAAQRAAQAVLALNTAPLIAKVNRDFARQRARYHLSEMPQLAARLDALCGAALAGKLSAAQVARALSGPPGGSPAVAPRPLPPASRPTSRPAETAEQLNQRGIARGRAGQLEEALAFFDAALKRDANHHGARFNHAKVLAALGRPAEARKSYGELLRRAPDYTLGLVGLAELERGRDPRLARTLYQRAQKSPDYARLKGLIDRRLQELGVAP